MFLGFQRTVSGKGGFGEGAGGSCREEESIRRFHRSRRSTLPAAAIIGVHVSFEAVRRPGVALECGGAAPAKFTRLRRACAPQARRIRLDRRFALSHILSALSESSAFVAFGEVGSAVRPGLFVTERGCHSERPRQQEVGLLSRFGEEPGRNPSPSQGEVGEPAASRVRVDGDALHPHLYPPPGRGRGAPDANFPRSFPRGQSLP